MVCHRCCLYSMNFNSVNCAAFISNLESVTCSFSSSQSMFLVCAVTQDLSVAVQAVVYHNHTPLSSSSGNWGSELNWPHCHNIKDKYWKKAHSQDWKTASFISRLDECPINHLTFLLLFLLTSDKLIFCFHSDLPETIKHWTYVFKLMDFPMRLFSTPQVFKSLCEALRWEGGRDTSKMPKICFQCMM